LDHVSALFVVRSGFDTNVFRWVDADSAVVNPAIPLDIFLPPNDFPDTHILVTKDQNGFNAGMLLLRVHKWSINLLADAMALRQDPEVMEGFAEQTALYILFNHTENREHVLFQPRKWFNTYEFHFAYEGAPGDLFVHFVGLAEDRFQHMEKWLGILEGPERQQWEIPLEQTTYPSEIASFWTVMRDGKETVKSQGLNSSSLSESLREARDHLELVLWSESDQPDTVRNATNTLRNAIADTPGFAAAKNKY
jgi:galactosyl transferase GMA12/MNN10 family